MSTERKRLPIEERIRGRIRKTKDEALIHANMLKEALGNDTSKWEFRGEFVTHEKKQRCVCGTLLKRGFPLYNKDDPERVCYLGWRCAYTYFWVDPETAEKMIEVYRKIELENRLALYRRAQGKQEYFLEKVKKEWAEVKQRLQAEVMKYDDWQLPKELADFVNWDWPRPKKEFQTVFSGIRYYYSGLKKMKTLLAKYEGEANKKRL